MKRYARNVRHLPRTKATLRSVADALSLINYSKVPHTAESVRLIEHLAMFN